jgi:1,4-dihydroxy-2-naphthoate octaprenyltransferase
LPAVAIGFLSVGVLNLNNMRDEISDRKAGKNTIVVKIGGANAKQYHYFLVITAMVLLFIFGLLKDFAIDQYLYLIVFLPLTSHLMRVKRNTSPVELDPELKRLAISTFMVALLLSLCLIYFLSDIIVNN